MLTLNYQLLIHVMGGYTQITAIPSNLERYISFTISDVTFIELYQFMLSSLNNLSRNLSKYQFRETRKYLESFYIQQPNQLQTNNLTECGKENKAMYFHEDYPNYPYQPPTFTSDQQHQIEEDLALMTGKGNDPYKYMDFFERFKNHSYRLKTPSIVR